MRKNELEQKIKESALNIEVKDYSALIIEKQILIDERQSIPQQTKPKFNFRLIFSGMMVALATVIFVIVLYPKEIIPPVDHPTIESQETAMAVSSIQALSMMEENEEDNTDDVAQFSLSLFEQKNTIKTKIDQINKYLRATEKIYASQVGYETKLDEVNEQGYANRLRFRTKDFTNQENTYEIYFNQTIDLETNVFTLIGEINYQDQVYMIDATGDVETNQFEMTTKRNDDDYIIVYYEKESEGHEFQIETYKDQEIVETVHITLSKVGEMTQTVLTFIEDQATSTFTIETSFENQNRVMKIEYSIQSDNDVLEGNMTLRIIKQAGLYFYVLTIKPFGGNAFSYNRRRGGLRTGLLQTQILI